MHDKFPKRRLIRGTTEVFLKPIWKRKATHQETNSNSAKATYFKFFCFCSFAQCSKSSPFKLKTQLPSFDIFLRFILIVPGLHPLHHEYLLYVVH